MKIKCLIVDDEPLAVSLLADYIGQVPFLELVHSCYNAMEALAFLHKNTIDLIFMDINMPHLSGMELSNLLDKKQKIIFTTAYSHYAVESYERNALDYLLKPITFERFVRAVTRAWEMIEKSKENTLSPQEMIEEPIPQTSPSVFLKTGKAVVKVDLAKIDFIEGLKDYVLFVIGNEKHIVYKRMKDLETGLSSDFYRIHHSYIVNINNIRKIENNHVFIGEHRIAISEKYREGFINKIQEKLI
jgi:two-component system, LytTR family, response regulator